MSAGHGRRSKAFNQLTHAHFHEDKADPPKAALHQVETQEPGDEKIDIARTGVGHQAVLYRSRVGAALRALQSVVDYRAGDSAFGPCLIKFVGTWLSGVD